ncbi:MAG: DUF4105 domain-containing protein [Rickettsiales bacterium]|jgi:hypothetical protein|nr:DUF4105 domain-containing protein [Rickettsiales bacterium]
MKKIVLLLLCFLFLNPVFADNRQIDGIIKKIDEMKLYDDPMWVALLHYKTVNINSFRSTITDKEFFLAEDGNKNLRSEMIATVKGFFEEKVEEKEQDRKFKGGYESKILRQHPQCAFIARYEWLDSKLNISKSLKKQKCFEFKKWHKDFDGKSMTMVFASNYISNPASMFGHTFLRVDKDKENTFNSETINYAAITSQNPTALGFALSGFFGGYPGIFTFTPYYEKIKSYGTVDNRDLIEYNLNLSEKEVDFFVKHIWELSYLYSDYYFINHNCSSFLIDLLNVIRPEMKLSEELGLAVLPSKTVRMVIDNKMVEDVKFRPSMQNKIKNRYKQLSDEEQKVARSVDMQKVNLVENEGFQALNRQSKANVVDIIYDMQQYMLATKRMDVLPMRYNSFVLLREKNELGINSDFDDNLVLQRVEQGHDQKTLSVYSGWTNLKDSFISLAFMPLYHQLLDDDYGYVPFSQIKVLELKLSYLLDQEKFYLDKLTFFDLVSIVSDEAFFKSLSWKIGLNYQKFEDYKRWNINKNTFDLDGALGKSYKVAGQNVYGFVEGGIKWSSSQELFRQDFLAYGGINLGFTFGYKKIKNIFDARWNVWTDAAYNNYSFTNSFGYNISKNNRIELNLKFVGLYNTGRIDRQIAAGFSTHF